MTDTTTYPALLARAVAAAGTDDDPDGLAVRQALLLAAHAGLGRTDDAGGADWDLYTVAISQAVADQQADLEDLVVLPPDVPDPGPDSVELRRAVVDVVGRLAYRYAAAAAGNTGSPWRRLVWAQVAHRLDDAAMELT